MGATVVGHAPPCNPAHSQAGGAAGTVHGEARGAHWQEVDVTDVEAGATPPALWDAGLPTVERGTPRLADLRGKQVL